MPRKKLPKDELKRFVRETPFTTSEVSKLWARFARLDADDTGALVLQEMLKIEELQVNPFAARMVSLFSEDGSGELDFQKFINMMSVFSPRATPQTKTIWAFALWDFDGDDLIGNQDIKKGLYLLTDKKVDVAEVTEAQDLLKTASTETKNSQGPGHGELLTWSQINQIQEKIAEEIDPEGVGLSFGDFESIASRMPDFISSFRMSI